MSERSPETEAHPLAEPALPPLSRARLLLCLAWAATVLVLYLLARAHRLDTWWR